MEMSSWYSIDYNPEKHRKTIKIKGSSVDAYPSPYDVPDQYCCTYHKRKGLICFQFSYTSSRERLKKNKIDDCAVVYQGVHSNRIFKITIMAVCFDGNVEFVVNRIKSIVSQLRAEADKENHIMHYDVVDSALDAILKK